MDGALLTPQTAAVPFRPDASGRYEVLLITSGAGLWSLPKGHVDPGRTAPDMAEVEAFEEAGVVGRALRPSLGTVLYQKPRGKRCRVEVYALRVHEVLECWQEQHRRNRRWVPLSNLPTIVEFKPFAPVLHALENRLHDVIAA